MKGPIRDSIESLSETPAAAEPVQEAFTEVTRAECMQSQQHTVSCLLHCPPVGV